jgi:signal transduction histidine kinase
LKPLTLRARLSWAFALAVVCALLCFSGAAVLVLWLDARSEVQAHSTGGGEDYDDVWKAVNAMLAVSPLVIVAAATAGNMLARRAIAPLTEASRRARLAQATGTMLEIPRSGNGPEWDELADTLNALLTGARAAYESIQGFTADAAHELRNPVTAILGEADLALRRPSATDQDALAWSVVREQAHRLRKLLDSLLALARADAGKLETSGEFDLDELIAYLIPTSASDSQKPGRMVSLRGSAGRVRGNPELVRRAVANLLDNALRYATHAVTIVLRRGPDGAHVQVIDDGPGVPPPLQERIFDRFFREDQSADAPGFGLGLSIARAIAFAHRGSLRYVPRERGACFELVLPLVEAETPSSVTNPASAGSGATTHAS